MEKKEAMKILKDFHDKSALFSVRTALETIFPELRESEDEKIRKELLSFCQNRADNYPNDPKYKNISAWIAWLKKQGEKTQGKTALEAAKEEKVDNANKIEPKFHEGDWVVISTSDGRKVVQVVSIEYFSSGQPRYITSEGKWLGNGTKARLWTINDAKDGDVVVNGSNIFIFHFLNDTRLMGYCHVNIDDGRFYDDIGKNECFCLIDAVVTPATKEQRDLLFAKMREAGWEWDDEKKELRKILKLSNSAKVGMDEESMWTEEDEEELKIAIETLHEAGQHSSAIWLKSLKQRMEERR